MTVCYVFWYHKVCHVKFYTQFLILRTNKHLVFSPSTKWKFLHLTASGGLRISDTFDLVLLDFVNLNNVARLVSFFFVQTLWEKNAGGQSQCD